MADEVKFDPELRKKYTPIRPRVQKILQALPQSVDQTAKKTIRNTAAENLIELSEEGRTDPITGLRNERGFKESLRSEVERAIRNGQVLGLISFDLDNFKLVNDNYGHDKGDDVLRAIATILNDHAPGKESTTRTIDIVARKGGDEFVIISPDIKGGLELTAGRIRLAIESKLKNLVPDITDLPVTASIGATSYTPNPEQQKKHSYEEVEKIMDQLEKESDIALYQSKHGGKNKVTIYQQGMTQPTEGSK